MFIGVEATTDYWITFQDLSHLKEQKHLGVGLNNAHALLGQGKGEEEVIDHISQTEATQLLEKLVAQEVIVENALGGNAALETLAGKTQGLSVSFFGALPQLNISNAELEALRESFVGEEVEETPLSLIIQVAHGTTERYILNKGNGRRANDILPSLSKAQEIISGDDILLGMVGIHVLFGTKRFNLLKAYRDALVDFRRKVGMTFSDTGGFAAFTLNEIKKLFEHTYTHVNALALNEVELINVYNALEGSGGEEHPVEMLAYLIEQSEALTTAWLHSTDYHISLSSEFSSQKMIESMKKAAAAGCFRVEAGRPPIQTELLEIIKQRRLNSSGVQATQEIKKTYGKKYKGLKIAVWPSYFAEYFTTSVGAGDTACVTYFGNFLSTRAIGIS